MEFIIGPLVFILSFPVLYYFISIRTQPDRKRKRKMSKHKSKNEYLIPEGYTMKDLRHIVAVLSAIPDDVKPKVLVKMNGELKSIRVNMES